jgi:phosphopantetheine--protein transferase-like protein
MNEQKLREIVSKLAKVDPGQLSAETPLNGPLGGSFGRARLDANLRSQFGVSNPAVYNVNTFGDLCAVLGIGTPSGPASVAAELSNISPLKVLDRDTAGNGISVGADVESVAAMPEVSDYWEDDFYKSTFTSREIAHALLRPSPRASFAAMWCAKEALRKADASLGNVDWRTIEVTHDDLGKPGLLVNGRKPAGALSLSHTDDLAFAVFVFAQLPQRMAAPTSPLQQQPIVVSQRNSGRSASIAAALALLLSVAALVYSLLYH